MTTLESRKLIFNTFLKANGCYKKFYANLGYPKSQVDQILSTTYKWADWAEPLWGTFIWSNTPEGGQYWAFIYDRWQKFFAAIEA